MSKTFKNCCGECFNFSPDRTYCTITGLKVTEKDFCSYAVPKETKRTCNICGNPIPKAEDAVIEVRNGKGIRIICPTCIHLMGTCARCVEGPNCVFETSPLNIPKVVSQQIKQGQMIMVQQVKNPARIKETCMKGCCCWDGNDCLKQEGSSCKNYKEV